MPSIPNIRTNNDLKYRSHRALTWSYLPLPNGKVCKVGQTVAQWWRSCSWKKPGVQAACTDRSRVPDTRRVPVRSRGSRTFVQIEAGGFYPTFYGVYGNAVPMQEYLRERRSHAFPPHYTPAYDVAVTSANN